MRTVPDVQIQQALDHGDPQGVVDLLVAAALAAGGPDNVTVLAVDAAADGPKNC
jgi:serine/threonine protein phosphatase PrpC